MPDERIRSRKALDYLKGVTSHPLSQVAQKAEYVVADIFIPKLIEVAEQDARERAIMAFRHACNCGDTHSPCEIYEECSAFKLFLKHYDNE